MRISPSPGHHSLPAVAESHFGLSGGFARRHFRARPMRDVSFATPEIMPLRGFLADSRF
ncbi:hypothetical protein HC231_14750 [Brenneria izadpanahii]|uniref:Uncharacterized protein n=1 Tax=Brenneria izadpanahii TaxID=2722756 RepID=A0ABX7UTL2_9GAMM|nr:hypothetical protein [Brenneria izadpanahii]QTF09026.1 hypothetical protein HC231_14750 [Brenneria izadpanahii]